MFYTAAILTGNATVFRVHDGGIQTIYCNTQGIPNASVSWEVDGNRLSVDNDTDHFNFNTFRNGSLIIMNPLTNRRFGLVNITCFANSTTGNTTRTSYQVILLKGMLANALVYLINLVTKSIIVKSILQCPYSIFYLPSCLRGLV